VGRPRAGGHHEERRLRKGERLQVRLHHPTLTDGEFRRPGESRRLVTAYFSTKSGPRALAEKRTLFLPIVGSGMWLSAVLEGVYGCLSYRGHRLVVVAQKQEMRKQEMRSNLWPRRQVSSPALLFFPLCRRCSVLVECFLVGSSASCCWRGSQWVPASFLSHDSLIGEHWTRPHWKEVLECACLSL
jgi:hypothetical protein